MTTSKCPDCIEVKDKPNTYRRCETCGHYRRLTEAEQKRVAKRA